jgi:methylenetetrahydrofolate dehydrogenase (NADP+)/methenyltetrahydrofolate cyclohydrolase
MGNKFSEVDTKNLCSDKGARALGGLAAQRQWSEILKLLEAYHISAEGKHVVVLGRSLIVGRPIANLLGQHRDFCNATVTCCHRSTKNLESLFIYSFSLHV